MNANDVQYDPKKFTEVQQMLKELYGSDNIPPFEVRKNTVEILHQMLRKMKVENMSNVELVNYYNKASISYAEKANKLKQSLETINLSLDDLSAEYNEAIRALAKAACKLDLDEPTSSNFLLAFNHMGNKEFEISEATRKLLQEQHRLTKKHDAFVGKLAAFEMDLLSLNENNNSQLEEMTQRDSKTSFVQSKIEQYRMKIEELTKKSSSSGFESSISHQEMARKHQEVLKLEEQLNNLVLKLNSYQSLPPNAELTKLKIEEVKRNLQRIEQEVITLL